MMLEYNYDNGIAILDHFKKSELATLYIKTIKTMDKSKFVMEYTLVNDYPEHAQEKIKLILSNSLSDRLQLINVLEQFIENVTLNNVNNFSLRFNALVRKKCELNYSFSYKVNKDSKHAYSINDLIECLETYDRIVTEMGIHSQEIPKVFKKNSGKNKKLTPVTIKEIGDILRKSLLGE